MRLQIILFAIAFLALCQSEITAQVFEVEETGIISDLDEVGVIPAFYLINVDGLRSTTGADFGLERICLHIEHQRPSDLKIELLSPAGTNVWLSNRNGYDNDYGYLNTCFVASGFDGPTYQPRRFFEGEYSAEGRLDFFNDGEDPNGTWLLIITDLRSGVLGKLDFCNLTFGSNPAFSAGSTCDLSFSESCISSDTDDMLLPDLIISKRLTEENITYFDGHHSLYPNQVRFAAAMANIGHGPLHIITTGSWYCGDVLADPTSICQDGSHPTNNVQQVIYKKGPDEIVFDTTRSGVMYFDDSHGHNHYHVKNWATFEVLQKRWWTTNPNRWKRLAVSEKVSYCLFDNKTCNTANQYCEHGGTTYSQENLPNYGLGRFVSCNNLVQGISVGGVDYYGMFYEGQHVSLPSNISAGKYYLRITVDPDNHYREEDDTNNQVIIPFIIGDSVD